MLELHGFARAGSHDLVVNGDQFNVVPPREAEADATIECDGETYLLFAYRRLTIAQCESSERMIIDGDRDQLNRFEAWFKGL